MSEDEMKRLEESLKQYMKDILADFRNDCDVKFQTKQDAYELQRGIFERLSNYVKWNTFTWILIVLMTIVSGLFGVIYYKLESVDTKTSQTREEVAQLNGRLAPFEFIVQ